VLRFGVESTSKQDAGTRSQDQSLEGLSFSFDTVNDSHTRQGDKTRKAVVLSELAKNNPEEFLKSLSKVFDDGKINLRDPIFENNAELIGLVKARCVPAESTQVIKFIDLLARSSEHDGVSADSAFRMEFDSSQQDITLGEDSPAHVVKYSYKQTATLEFNEKNIIITHKNGNILTLSATKNPYQGSVSYTVGNDAAKNLGEAWNHDLKDIVVMFLTTGKLDTENHDDGNVWRIPSEAETEKSESINFLKDVAEGVKAKVAAEVEASEAEEGDAKLQGPTKGEVNSEAPAAPAGSAQASEHSSISESAGNIQVVDGLAALANAAQQVETRSQAPSDIPASSNSSQTTQSDGQTQIYKKGTSIKDVKLEHSEAKAAEYPTLDKHTSITSVADIIQKVKEAGGQALVSIRLQKDAIRGHAHNGFRTKIINLLETSPVTDAQADMTWPSWSAPPQAPKVSQNDSFAILREGQDGKFYVTMRFTFAEADGQNDGYKQKVDRDARPTQPSLILPFNKKEDALSCIAYLSEDMTKIPALIEELIPDLKEIDYENLVKPSDDYNKNLHFFEDATN
jgi:Tfp pilus assembly protein PilV